MSSLLPSLLIAAVLGLLPARIAAAKGRSFRRWWLYGWMMFVIALPHALLLRSRPVAGDVSVEVASPEPTGPVMGPCPACGREVRADTPACPYCRASVAAP